MNGAASLAGDRRLVVATPAAAHADSQLQITAIGGHPDPTVLTALLLMKRQALVPSRLRAP